MTGNDGRARRPRRAVALGAAAIAVALALGAGCRSVPMTGRTQLMLSFEVNERAIGAAAYEEYKEKCGISSVPGQQELLQRVGQAIKNAAGEYGENFEWEFNVLQSKTVNAFCYPGGKVAVLTGIMPKFANEAELAAVVGHEVAHAIARHGGERQSWGYLKAAGTFGLSIWGDSRAEEIYGIGTEYGVMLPYSRSHESEADLMGLLLMAKAGYNPRAAVSFWQRFGSDTSIIDEFFSTHPGGGRRISDILEHMPEAEELYGRCSDKRGLGVKLINGIPQNPDSGGARTSDGRDIEFTL